MFGAFTDIFWNSDGGYKNGNQNTFIFSLGNDFNFVKLKCLRKYHEVYHHEKLLTSIGEITSGFRIL